MHLLGLLCVSLDRAISTVAVKEDSMIGIHMCIPWVLSEPSAVRSWPCSSPRPVQHTDIEHRTFCQSQLSLPHQPNASMPQLDQRPGILEGVSEYESESLQADSPIYTCRFADNDLWPSMPCRDVSDGRSHGEMVTSNISPLRSETTSWKEEPGLYKSCGR